MSGRRFYEGQKINGKIVSCVFRNGAKTEYLVIFTDGSEQIYKFSNN